MRKFLAAILGIDTPASNALPAIPAIDYKATLSAKFRPIEREMNSIRTKASMKRPTFLFEVHTYSIEELMQLPHWNTIRACAEKIASDVNNWIHAGSFHPDAQRAYDQLVSRFNQALSSLENEIASRGPTFIERVFETIRAVTDQIRKVLPAVRFIAGTCLGLPEGASDLLPGRRRHEQLALPGSRSVSLFD